MFFLFYHQQPKLKIDFNLKELVTSFQIKIAQLLIKFGIELAPYKKEKKQKHKKDQLNNEFILNIKLLFNNCYHK